MNEEILYKILERPRDNKNRNIEADKTYLIKSLSLTEEEYNKYFQYMLDNGLIGPRQIGENTIGGGRSSPKDSLTVHRITQPGQDFVDNYRKDHGL